MLEIFDGGDFTDFAESAQDIYDLSNILREYVQELLEMNSEQNSLALSYALAFVGNVNYYEIAESIWNEYVFES